MNKRGIFKEIFVKPEAQTFFLKKKKKKKKRFFNNFLIKLNSDLFKNFLLEQIF